MTTVKSLTGHMFLSGIMKISGSLLSKRVNAIYELSIPFHIIPGYAGFHVIYYVIYS